MLPRDWRPLLNTSRVMNSLFSTGELSLVPIIINVYINAYIHIKQPNISILSYTITR